jgi:hypothetical protein
MVSGVILGAFGLGSFFYGFISMALVNPNNESPELYSNGQKYYSEDISNRVNKFHD